MRINFIGIGKMGYPLVQNLLNNHHEVFVYDVDTEQVDKIIREEKISGTTDFSDFLENSMRCEVGRVFWVMLPPGEITNGVLRQLLDETTPGDIVIDGGNSHHKSSMYFADNFAKKDVYFLDVGTSGGINGARFGASLMIGGDKLIYEQLKPMFASISKKDGYLYTGKPGSAHFLKLVHNAIYYGYQQALGEGLEILYKSEFDYDLLEVTRVLKETSVIRGWLLEVIHDSLKNDSSLENYSGHVKASKSTNWVIEEAMEMGIPVPAMYSALSMRHRGVQDDQSFSGKVISALRSGVGGYSPSKK